MVPYDCSPRAHQKKSLILLIPTFLSIESTALQHDSTMHLILRFSKSSEGLKVVLLWKLHTPSAPWIRQPCGKSNDHVHLGPSKNREDNFWIWRSANKQSCVPLNKHSLNPHCLNVKQFSCPSLESYITQLSLSLCINTCRNNKWEFAGVFKSILMGKKKEVLHFMLTMACPICSAFYVMNQALRSCSSNLSTTHASVFLFIMGCIHWNGSKYCSLRKHSI